MTERENTHWGDLTWTQAPQATQPRAFAWGSGTLGAELHQADDNTAYLLDGPSVLAEYDNDGNQTESHVNNPQRIDEQFARTQVVNGTATKLWPIVDARTLPTGVEELFIDPTAELSSPPTWLALLPPDAGTEFELGLRWPDSAGIPFRAPR